MLKKTRGPVRVIWGVAFVALLAFVLRMIGLVQVPARWDEGWSVAHASLNLSELFTITAEDVHPPLFYMLLGAWQSSTGITLFGDRFLAVMMSMPAIPLTYAAAKRWSGSVRLGLIATGLMAWLPLAVYYSAVIRMYALAPAFVILATWAALRLLDSPAHSRVWPMVAFVVGATGAMLTLYHAVWALTALGLYILIVAGLRGSRKFISTLSWLAIGVGVSLAAYAPWAIFAIPQLLQRASADTGNIAQAYPLTYYLRLGVEGLVMTRWVGQAGLWVMGGLLAGGLIAWSAGFWRRGQAHRTQLSNTRFTLLQLLLPLLTVVFTLLGVGAGARNWAFNERMLICAVAMLAFWLAWAFDKLAQRWRVMAVVGVIGLIAVYFTASTSAVYQKTLEVFDPYNPHTYAQHIVSQAQPDDLVVFNVLSPAGFYALDRRVTDPAWSYALTWDPVI
ncbi:MAG TPA: glycosyltransferase family 39 protein, partial [Anaerolineae bacterium]